MSMWSRELKNEWMKKQSETLLMKCFELLISQQRISDSSI